MSKTLEQLLTEAKAMVALANSPKSDYGSSRECIEYARTALPVFIEALELAIEQRTSALEGIDWRHESHMERRIAEQDQAIAAILTKGTT